MAGMGEGPGSGEGRVVAAAWDAHNGEDDCAADGTACEVEAPARPGHALVLRASGPSVGELLGRIDWLAGTGAAGATARVVRLDLADGTSATGFALVDAMRGFLGEPAIEAGCEDSRRLLALHAARRSSRDPVPAPPTCEDALVAWLSRWVEAEHPGCTLAMEAMEDEWTGEPEVYLDTLEVPAPGSGRGSAIMGRVCAMADAFGVRLTSKPTQIGRVPLEALVAFNRRFGFERLGADVFMTRVPAVPRAALREVPEPCPRPGLRGPA